MKKQNVNCLYVWHTPRSEDYFSSKWEKIENCFFLKVLANFDFDSLQDMHGNGFDAKFELNNWKFSLLG